MAADDIAATLPSLSSHSLQPSITRKETSSCLAKMDAADEEECILSEGRDTSSCDDELKGLLSLFSDPIELWVLGAVTT